jgi:hypothetical protein
LRAVTGATKQNIIPSTTNTISSAGLKRKKSFDHLLADLANSDVDINQNKNDYKQTIPSLASLTSSHNFIEEDQIVDIHSGYNSSSQSENIVATNKPTRVADSYIQNSSTVNGIFPVDIHDDRDWYDVVHSPPIQVPIVENSSLEHTKFNTHSGDRKQILERSISAGDITMCKLLLYVMNTTMYYAYCIFFIASKSGTQGFGLYRGDPKEHKSSSALNTMSAGNDNNHHNNITPSTRRNRKTVSK